VTTQRPGSGAGLVTLVLLGLTGCAVLNPPPPHTNQPTPVQTPSPSPIKPPADKPTPVPAAPAQTVPEPSPVKPVAPVPVQAFVLKPPLNALVEQANAQSRAGQLEAAAATLDRAVRIDPKNALLWIELARLRLLEADPVQAQALARKAMALSRQDPKAQKDAKDVLDAALKYTPP
jgi:tetratricopeptide (TPR) repeat protein